MGVYLGVDLGAAHTKAVIIAASRFIMGRAIVPTGMDFCRAGRKVLRLALADAGLKATDIAAAVATGYGRKNLDFAAATKTEISCHARGAFHYFPEAITVVDIGGQDSKIIKIGPDGRWFDFKMNRKCAAGTGAFLEEIAGRIGVRLSDLEGLARQSSAEVTLSSFCTVFCSTEILGMIRRGIKVPDIVKAVMRSVAARATEMDVLDGKVVATGGVVAHHPLVAELLAAATGNPVLIAPEPQLAGALGAALIALEETAYD
jgi:(R)-2-hydroxyacyl-CoA dehydratese activating ATPase